MKEQTTEREDRRREDMRAAREEINLHLSQGMDRNIAVNFVLSGNKIAIADKKEVRKSFKYGCYTISSIAQDLHDINRENSSNLVLEAVREPVIIAS
jgi:hypothetical protein